MNSRRLSIRRRTPKRSCHSPTSIEDTPVIVLLEGYLSVAGCEKFLSQDRTLFPGPCDSVGVQLKSHHHTNTNSYRIFCCGAYLCPRIHFPWTHSAGISKVLIRHIGAGRAELPGVAEQLGCGLYDALPCCEIIFCISVKVTTQTSNSAPQMGRQSYIHTHTCEECTLLLQAQERRDMVWE